MNGVHGNGDRGAGRDVKAADGVVFHRDARDGMNRRMQAQRFVDDLAGVLQVVDVFRGREAVAQHLGDFVAHLRANCRVPRQRPVDPAQPGGRSLVAGEEQRGDLVAQRLVVELVAFGAAGRDDALEHAAAFEIRGAMALDESEDAGVERGDGRVEARDQLLRMRDERAHDIARRLRPVFLDGRGHFAEFIGDVGERLAQQVTPRQQLRQAVELRFDVEDLAAIGVAIPAMQEMIDVLGPSSPRSCRWLRA